MSKAGERYITGLQLAKDPLDCDLRGAEITESMSATQGNVFSRVCHIPDRAKLAVAKQLVDWVAARLEQTTDVTQLRQFSESLQLATIDGRYVREVPLPRAEDGVAYVLFAAWTEANAQRLKQDDLEGDPSCIIALIGLIRHITPKSRHKQLSKWLGLSLDRLESYCRLDDEDEEDPELRLGPFVPEELFEPRYDFTPAAVPALTKAFLKRMDPQKNPYLLSAEELRAKGFEGTPYRL